jgi:hypothetical protein
MDHSYIIHSNDLIDLKVALNDLINRYDAVISQYNIKDENSYYHTRKKQLIELAERSAFNKLQMIKH